MPTALLKVPPPKKKKATQLWHRTSENVSQNRSLLHLNLLAQVFNSYDENLVTESTLNLQSTFLV